jgi:hypothetical protein
MNRKSDVEESSRRPADGSEHFETVIIGGGQGALGRVSPEEAGSAVRDPGHQ